MPGVMALLATMTAALAASDFVIEPQPEASCPDAATLRQSLSARLGNRDGGNAWRILYGASGVGAQRLWLELRDGRDRVHLRRELPLSGAECGKVADAIALIAERFFEDLGWTAGSPLPEPMPLPPQPPPSAPSIAEERSVPTRVWVEGGGGLSTRRNLGGTALAGARVEHGRLGVALHLLVPTTVERQFRAEGGEASLFGFGGAVSIVWRGEYGRLGWFVGPVATVFRESARSQDIAVPKTQSATSLTGGLTAGATVALGSHWRLGTDATVSHAVVQDRFVVGGWGPVLEPSPFQAAALVRVAYNFSP